MTPDENAAPDEWDTFDSRASCPCGDRGHWAHMQCRRTDAHAAHTFNNRHCLYGPYQCGGRP